MPPEERQAFSLPGVASTLPDGSPSVTVVVPTWRRPELLGRCLDGVLAQNPAPAEVLVVARREDLEALEVIEGASSRGQVRWVEVSQPGHVPPVLAALDAATTDLIAFIDDDAVPDLGWLAALLDVMRDPSVVCAGGRVHTEGSAPVVHPDAGTVRWYGQHVGNVAAVDAFDPFEVDSVMEMNWCWRTSVLRSLSFDPVLARDDASMYGLDLCLQAKAEGGRVVYTSAARVVHTPGPRHDGSISRDDRRRTYRSYGRNYTLIALRRFRGMQRVTFVLWWWLVGERGSYGLSTAAVDATTGRAAPGTVAASFAGKLEGTRAWLRTR